MRQPIDIETLLEWAFRVQKVESRENPPQDAETMQFAVMALPDPYCDIVRHHARIGRPPEWRSDPEARVIHLAAVRHWRERYCQWHQALVVLRHSVNGSLVRFAVTGPAAPAEPWKDNADTGGEHRIRAF